MSESIADAKMHYLNLQAYCSGMVEGKNGKALYEKYKDEIASCDGCGNHAATRLPATALSV